VLEFLKQYAEVISFLGFLATLYGLKLGYKQITAANAQNDLALKQFNERPEISLSVFHPDAANDIYIVLPVDPEKLFLVPLPISIANIGEKSAKEIRLRIGLSKQLYAPEILREKKYVPNFVKAEYDVDSQSGSGLVTVHHQFPNLTPRSGCNVQETILIHDATLHNNSVKAVSRDGVPVVVDYRFAFSMRVEVTVSCDDLPPLHKNYRIHVRSGSKETLREFLNAENEMLSSNDISFWRAAWNFLRRRKPDAAKTFPVSVIYFTDFDIKEIEGKKICRAPPEYTLAQGYHFPNRLVVPALEVTSQTKR